MMRRLTLACSVLLAWLASDSLPAAERPNIIIVLADDLGYSDLGCYGGEIDTPHLDRLAASGLRFSQFYNTARCCPTRAALLTGLYPHQAGIGHMTADQGHPAYRGSLNDSCVTIAEALGPAGYATLMTGKWHVGSAPEQWPRRRGFQRYFGTPSGGGVYFKGTLEVRQNVFFVLDDQQVEVPEDFYVTEAFTDHALEFVEDAVRGEQPFLLYLAHVAPHWPLQARPDDIRKYDGRYDAGWDVIRAARYRRQVEMGLVDPRWSLSARDPQAKAWDEMSSDEQQELASRMEIYAAQVDAIDQNLGRLVEKLQALDAFDNTVIFFLSDNGCSAEGGPGGFSRGLPGEPIGAPRSYASLGLEWANAANTPWRDYKMDTHEGGISTPMIVHWPKGFQRTGELEHQPAHVIDLMPTCLELAGVAYPAERNGTATQSLEGVSLVPALRGEALEREALYWEHEGNRAIRAGRWKLVASHGQDWELYDLEADRTEQSDLANTHPAQVARLAALWQAWAQRCGVQPWPVRAAPRVNQN